MSRLLVVLVAAFILTATAQIPGGATAAPTTVLP
jgi:hypothetical protein